MIYYSHRASKKKHHKFSIKTNFFKPTKNIIILISVETKTSIKKTKKNTISIRSLNKLYFKALGRAWP